MRFETFQEAAWAERHADEDLGAQRHAAPRATRHPLRMGLSLWRGLPERKVGAAIVMPYANTEAMNLQLEEISKAVSPGAHAALVLDSAGWHGSEELVVPDNITTVTLPPYSPELNPAENMWESFSKNKISNRQYEIYEDIVICATLGSD